MKQSGLKIIETLENNGFEAYFIGGSVRNFLHNLRHNDKIPIKDYDIVTNASYEQVKSLFKHVESRGESFQVAVVKLKGFEFEVAQYRGEAYPKGGSLRPDKVYKVETLREDIDRRDFTMNGIAMDKNGLIIDLINGCKDIGNQVIKTIGDPSKRFGEDPLRMLRAFRFMAQLGYSIDESTLQGIKSNINLLSKIPHERVKEEMNKLVKGQFATLALKTMRDHIKEAKFSNTIKHKQPILFEALFSLNEKEFISTLTLFDSVNKENFLIEQIYSVLYKNVSLEKAKEEIENMGALNAKQIKYFSLLLKHKYFAIYPSKIHLLKLVKDIEKLIQGGRSDLDNILQYYSNLYSISFESLKDTLESPIFKKELLFNGHDVMLLAEKLNINNPGSLIGTTLELARTHVVLGKQFELEDLFKRVIERTKR